MEENKKFDVNSIIGFALIGLIMFIYFNWFMPKPETQLDKEQVVVQTEQVVESKPIVTTPAMTGNFTSTAFEKEVVLQNDLLNLTLSSKGAKIKIAEVKQYQSYEQKREDHQGKLLLITEENADFNIKFTENAQVVNTRDLIFNTTQNDNQVIFSTQTDSGGDLKIIYTLKENYLVEFDIQTTGLIITEKPTLQFDLKALAHEKGRSQELLKTDFHYALDKLKDVDYTASDVIENNIDWVAYKGQFFSVILDNQKAFDSSKMVLTNLDDSIYLKKFEMESTFSDHSLNANMQWYIGPNDRDLMSSHDRDYQEVIPFGWFIFGILNKWFFIPMYKFLASLGWFGGGIVIMIMTIIVKLVTAPIMHKQYKQGAIMRVLRPELDEINEKHKDADAMKRQQATMELYRKAGVNPMAGCIPALLQMPIFLALFNLFPNLINLRGKSFLWADDLSAYDSVIQLPFEIPMYGAHVSLFTLMYAISMFIYTRLSSSNIQQPTQPGMPDMRYIMYFMPIMLVVWINSYASGLSWYYFVSNTISIVLVLVIKKFFIDEDKIHAQLQENKKKPKKKKGKFTRMLEEAQRQQAQQAAARKKK
ncbi:MAG: membrane protein insertase YidC [Flavobacteriales bacterium]